MARKVLPVIMCGGAGTRVWPESRETMPKQFIPLIGAASTFQQTIKRLDAPMFDEPVVVTNHDYRFLVREQLEEIGAKATIVIEPTRRDSGPAVAIAAEIGAARDPETVVAVFAADHVVLDQKGFLAACATAAEAAARGRDRHARRQADRAGDRLRLHPPRRAARRSARRAASTPSSRSRTSKPPSATWRKAICGTPATSSSAPTRCSRNCAPSSRRWSRRRPRRSTRRDDDLGFLALDKEAFERSPKKSIDYAVMERTAARRGGAGRHRLVGRRQLGRGVEAQPARRRRQRHPRQRLRARRQERPHPLRRPADGGGRRRRRRSSCRPRTRCWCCGATRATRSRSSSTRSSAASAARRPSTSASIGPGAITSRSIPGARYQVKRIVVTPGRQLSLQKHFHRAEHWVVVKGTAQVTRGDEDLMVHENEFDLPADRRRAPARQSRQDRPRADRGADRLLSRRGRHRPPRGRLPPPGEGLRRDSPALPTRRARRETGTQRLTLARAASTPPPSAARP